MMNIHYHIQEDTAIHTFRNLPTHTQRRVSLEKLRYVLVQKTSYYTSLTYTEKCKVSIEKIAYKLYQKIKKYKLGVGPASIKNILLAEEAYYRDLNYLHFN